MISNTGSSIWISRLYGHDGALDEYRLGPGEF
jgi:hypothetical protein